MAEEYYIRAADSETARGPFDVDKIATLAEAGQVTRETLYYDDELESWATIGSNEELRVRIFPEKKKLSLRHKSVEELNLLNKGPEVDEKVTVDEMLAAAEGQTRDTRHLREAVEWQHRTANLAIPVIGSILLLSAISFIYPSMDVLNTALSGSREGYLTLLQRPLLLVGIFDLVLAIMLFLSVTEVYPLVRFRAAFGIGFFGFTYWAAYINGNEDGYILAGSLIAWGLGVFVATLTLNFSFMSLSALLGIAGALGYLYFNTIRTFL